MFSNVVYLNRDQDVNRKEVTEAQLASYKVPAIRFSAITESLQDFVAEPLESLNVNFAQVSCLISHLEIIRLYGDKELLVFEDDIDLSPSNYWGASFEEVLSCLSKSIGIAQLYVFPSYVPVTPRWWAPGTFSTAAYFIRPWYAQKLIDMGYIDGKWHIKEFACKYPQPVADAILYSNTSTVSFALFGIRSEKSTILPTATYTDTASVYGESWGEGKNNIEDIKTALAKFT